MKRIINLKALLLFEDLIRKFFHILYDFYDCLGPKNLVKHIDNKHISLINRTKGKAEKIAGKFDLTVKDYANLQAEVYQSDIVIVATGAQKPTIDKEVLVNTNKDLLLLDLSSESLNIDKQSRSVCFLE